MSDEFSRDPHTLKGYGAWLHEVCFPHLCNGAPCPKWKTDTNIRIDRWNQKGPRKVCTWKSYWWLDTKWYHCVTCNKDYLATDRDSIAALSVTLHEYFEIVITRICAYEKSFAEHIVRQIVMGQSAEDAARAVMELHMNRYIRHTARFYFCMCDSSSCEKKTVFRLALFGKPNRTRIVPQQVPDDW